MVKSVSSSSVVTKSKASLNAVKHGVLSNQLLLPHESAEDFASLLNQLMSEYNPVGITEKALVEDIANTIWRKRRLLSAERAGINKGLNESVTSPLMLANESDPTHFRLTESTALSHLIGLDTAGLSKKKDTINKAFEAIDEAIESGNPSEAFYSLPVEINETFDETETDIDTFISTTAIHLLYAELNAINYIEQIRQQAWGSAVLALPFDTLARYDSHLDRKLTRLLDTLLTLQTHREKTAQKPFWGLLQAFCVVSRCMEVIRLSVVFDFG